MIGDGGFWKNMTKTFASKEGRDGKFGPDVSPKKHNNPTKRNHKLM